MNYVYAGGESSDKETATKDKVDGKWKGGNWPGDAVEPNYEVNWYAYTSGTFYRTDDADKKPYIDFTVEESATKQHDLLVATAADTWAHCSGILSFTFDHACSALRFYVKKATNLNDHTLSVTSIVLHNVVKQGEYYFNTQSWTPTLPILCYSIDNKKRF